MTVASALYHRACMKSITVSVPDDVYQAAKVRAAENGTSVGAIVTAFLTSLVRSQAAFEALEAQQQRVLDGIERFRASDRASRDEAHDRTLR